MKENYFQAYQFVDRLTGKVLYHHILPIANDVDIVTQLLDKRARFSKENGIRENDILIAGSAEHPRLPEGFSLVLIGGNVK